MNNIDFDKIEDFKFQSYIKEIFNIVTTSNTIPTSISFSYFDNNNLKFFNNFDINENNQNLKSQFEKIESIIIMHQNLLEIPKWLKYFKNIKLLNLSGNKITKIENLEKLRFLKNLSLSGNPIKDLKGISHNETYNQKKRKKNYYQIKHKYYQILAYF